MAATGTAAAADDPFAATPWIQDQNGTVTIGVPPAGTWAWNPGMGSEPLARSRAFRMF
ncbi:MAG: hypothetical protein WD689_11050 [Gaiellaceae bacterium]